MAALRQVRSAGPDSTVGQKRLAIYAAVWSKVKDAKSKGCWLEAIALCESIIADRLEARLEAIEGGREGSRQVRTAAQNVSKLIGNIRTGMAGLEESDNTRALEIYNNIRQWSERRNTVLHELAKLLEGENLAWDQRYERSRLVADEGERLARQVSLAVKKLNRPRDR